MRRSIKQLSLTCQIETTLKHAKEIHRAMLGDKKAWETVKVEEVTPLQFRHSFSIFLEVNRSRLAIVEQGVR